MIDWEFVNKTFDGAQGLMEALSSSLSALAECQDLDLSGVEAFDQAGNPVDMNMEYARLVCQHIEVLTEVLLMLEERPKPKRVK